MSCIDRESNPGLAYITQINYLANANSTTEPSILHTPIVSLVNIFQKLIFSSVSRRVGHPNLVIATSPSTASVQLRILNDVLRRYINCSLAMNRGFGHFLTKIIP